ncbi:hypothetical protein KY314_03025 [Candidatus Woesearchaeota archaeon]|nr:hypothetical protein [Candidatus Woesearchaeota archaeon]
MTDLEKKINRLEKIVLVGFSGVLLALTARAVLDWYVLNKSKEEIQTQSNILKQEAKDTLKQKEIEWEMKLNSVPYQAINAIEEVVNKCIKEYYEDIDTNLPLEKKYKLVCNRFIENGKKDFEKDINGFKKDIANDAYDLIVKRIKNDVENLSEKDKKEIRKYIDKAMEIAVYEPD